jgi:hypothetical protein
MVERLLSVIYFAGLIMFGIATAKLTDVVPYGFMIVGGGAILYAGLGSIVLFLHKKG